MTLALHAEGGNLQFSGYRTIADWELAHKCRRQSNGTPKYDLELILGPRSNFDISTGDQNHVHGCFPPRLWSLLQRL